METDLPEHVRNNRAAWNVLAADYVLSGEHLWAESEPSWGIYRIPEADVGLLPDDLEGKDVIELGCGTGYVSAWLARRGATPIGIDSSPKQLETARRLQQEHHLDFPLHLGNAEATPFADASFDLAISEHGACVWCDPYKWIPEAARLLRPGGELIFLVNGLLLMLCTSQFKGNQDIAVTDHLQRDLFSFYRFDRSDGSVVFHLPHKKMIRLLRECGFEIEELIELQAPEGATTRYSYVTTEWARQWPVEEVWKARKQ